MNGELQRLHQIREEISLPFGRWAFFGSAVMVAHGIERQMRDVDVFCATQTWFSLFASSNVVSRPAATGWQVWCPDPDDTTKRCDPPYLYKTVCGIEVNVYCGWRRRSVGDLDVAWLIYNSREIRGVPVCSMLSLFDYKREVGRSKDVQDIRVIQEHMRVCKCPSGGMLR